MEGENSHTIFTSILTSLRPHILPVSIACIGLILIVYGLITSLLPKAPTSDITFETSEGHVKNQIKKDTENGNIVVDVSGGVLAPGVYRLSNNARVEDALHAAGGFSSDADLDWTQHSLNLAAKVTDGMKIYIPRVGEESTQLRPDSANATSGKQGFVGQAGEAVAGVSTNGMVSINSASSSELEALPGIGPVTAGKIIDNRPYGSIDELRNKNAVGKSVFEKIKELVSL